MEEKINKVIENFILGKLLDGFKDRKNRRVNKVDKILHINAEIDQEKSNLPMYVVIYVKEFNVSVEVESKFGGERVNQLSVFVPKSIKLAFNCETKTYYIENERELIVAPN